MPTSLPPMSPRCCTGEPVVASGTSRVAGPAWLGSTVACGWRGGAAAGGTAVAATGAAPAACLIAPPAAASSSEAPMLRNCLRGRLKALSEVPPHRSSEKRTGPFCPAVRVLRVVVGPQRQPEYCRKQRDGTGWTCSSAVTGRPSACQARVEFRLFVRTSKGETRMSGLLSYTGQRASHAQHSQQVVVLWPHSAGPRGKGVLVPACREEPGGCPRLRLRWVGRRLAGQLPPPTWVCRRRTAAAADVVRAPPATAALP